MDETTIYAIAYDDGGIHLTDRMLVSVNAKGFVQRAFELDHISEVDLEKCHSFRHRTLGLIFGLILLVPAFFGLGLIGLPNDRLPGLHGRVTIGVLFFLFFGILFLIGVARSREIRWLRFRYARVQQMLSLPGVASEEAERMVQLLRQFVE